jgi:hypothetical protein
MAAADHGIVTRPQHLAASFRRDIAMAVSPAIAKMQPATVFDAPKYAPSPERAERVRSAFEVCQPMISAAPVKSD